jgi:glycosyltransferase involved in cell wall biosynthesis
LLADPQEARRMGLAGRKLVVEHYSWARACAALEELYDTIDRQSQPTKDMTGA